MALRLAALTTWEFQDIPCNSQNMDQETPPSFVQPLNCSCPPSVSELSLCTTTGRRCRLLCCVDLGNGIHHSQSPLCHQQSELPSPSFVTPVNSVEPRLCPPAEPLSINPMRYRHRLSSRCGGNRGGAPHADYHPPSASSSPSVSLSPTLSNPSPHGRYPNTRSRRGRTSSNRARHSGSIPLHASTNASSQQAHLQFQSTLNKLRIMVTITVDFKEISASNSESLPSKDFSQVPSFNLEPGEPCFKLPITDKDLPSSSNPQTMENETHRKDKSIQLEDNAGGGHVEYSGFEVYEWCPIVEEEPTEETKQLATRSRGEQ